MVLQQVQLDIEVRQPVLGEVYTAIGLHWSLWLGQYPFVLFVDLYLFINMIKSMNILMSLIHTCIDS